MSRGISKRARSYIQAHAESNMTYECVIQRVNSGAFDEDSSVYTAGTSAELYAGPCRIWEVSGSSAFDVANEQIVLQQTKLSIPWDEGLGIRRDDEVKIVASAYDPALVGKRFRIMDVDKGGDLRATRRFTVQGVQEEM
jgi:hypothetical protein